MSCPYCVLTDVFPNMFWPNELSQQRTYWCVFNAWNGQMICPKCVLTDVFSMCSDQMICPKCVLTDVFPNVFWLNELSQMHSYRCVFNLFWPNELSQMLTYRCVSKCVLTKWIVPNADLQMYLQMCSDQVKCPKCVPTDVFFWSSVARFTIFFSHLYVPRILM